MFSTVVIVWYTASNRISHRLFLAPPPKKLKLRGKKLKEKTQPFGGLSLPYTKLKKNKIHGIFSSKLKIIKGVALFRPLKNKYFQKFKKVSRFFRNKIILSLKLKRKTQRKNSTSWRTCTLPPSRVV